MKKYIIIFIIYVALFLGFITPAESNVTIKVRAINPLEEEAPVAIHYPLPAGITAEDVIGKRISRGKGPERPADFQINFDETQKLYFVDHAITLAPKEIIVLEVEAKDVWTVPQKTIDDLRSQAEDLVKARPGGEGGEDAGSDPVAVKLKEEIFRQLEQVAKAQKENAIAQVGVEAHMKAYQKSRATLQQVQMDIAMLENMIAAQKEEQPQPEDAIPTPPGEVPAPGGAGTQVQTPSSPAVEAAEPPVEKQGVLDKLKGLFKRK